MSLNIKECVWKYICPLPFLCAQVSRVSTPERTKDIYSHSLYKLILGYNPVIERTVRSQQIIANRLNLEAI